MGGDKLNRLIGIAGAVSALLYAVQGSHAQIECHNCGINSRRRDLRANNTRRYQQHRNYKAGANSKWKLQTETPNGNSKRKLQTETPNGNSKRKLQTETPNGNSKRKLQTETPR